jgi:hypothetical protein
MLYRESRVKWRKIWLVLVNNVIYITRHSFIQIGSVIKYKHNFNIAKNGKDKSASEQTQTTYSSLQIM